MNLGKEDFALPWVQHVHQARQHSKIPEAHQGITAIRYAGIDLELQQLREALQIGFGVTARPSHTCVRAATVI